MTATFFSLLFSLQLIFFFCVSHESDPWSLLIRHIILSFWMHFHPELLMPLSHLSFMPAFLLLFSKQLNFCHTDAQIFKVFFDSHVCHELKTFLTQLSHHHSRNSLYTGSHAPFICIQKDIWLISHWLLIKLVFFLNLVEAFNNAPINNSWNLSWIFKNLNRFWKCDLLFCSYSVCCATR